MNLKINQNNKSMDGFSGNPRITLSRAAARSQFPGAHFDSKTNSFSDIQKLAKPVLLQIESKILPKPQNQIKTQNQKPIQSAKTTGLFSEFKTKTKIFTKEIAGNISNQIIKLTNQTPQELDKDILITNYTPQAIDLDYQNRIKSQNPGIVPVYFKKNPEIGISLQETPPSLKTANLFSNGDVFNNQAELFGTVSMFGTLQKKIRSNKKIPNSPFLKRLISKKIRSIPVTENNHKLSYKLFAIESKGNLNQEGAEINNDIKNNKLNGALEFFLISPIRTLVVFFSLIVIFSLILALANQANQNKKISAVASQNGITNINCVETMKEGELLQFLKGENTEKYEKCPKSENELGGLKSSIILESIIKDSELIKKMEGFNSSENSALVSLTQIENNNLILNRFTQTVNKTNLILNTYHAKDLKNKEFISPISPVKLVKSVVDSETPLPLMLLVAKKNGKFGTEMIDSAGGKNFILGNNKNYFNFKDRNGKSTISFQNWDENIIVFQKWNKAMNQIGITGSCGKINAISWENINCDQIEKELTEIDNILNEND